MWWIVTITSSRYRTKRSSTRYRAEARRADDPAASIPRGRPATRGFESAWSWPDLRSRRPSNQLSDLPGCHRQRGLNYLAIGDTHAFREFPPKTAPMVYPGAPGGDYVRRRGYRLRRDRVFPRQGRAPIIQKQLVARWKWREESCTSMGQLEALRHQDLKECVLRLDLDMEVAIAERARVDDILLELKGNEAVCGKVGVLHVESTGLKVNVRDMSDFEGSLPEVLRSVVTRLQEQSMGPEGAAARQALVLLHKTLRSLGGGRAEWRRPLAGALHNETFVASGGAFPLH